MQPTTMTCPLCGHRFLHVEGDLFHDPTRPVRCPRCGKSFPTEAPRRDPPAKKPIP